MKMLTSLTIVVLWMLHYVNGIDMFPNVNVEMTTVGKSSIRVKCMPAPENPDGVKVDWKVLRFKTYTSIDICSNGRVRDGYTPRFKLYSNNLDLLIDDVTVDDSGIYACAVPGGNTTGIPQYTQLIVEMDASATKDPALPKWAEIVMGVSGTLNLILLGVILGPKRAAQLCRQADQQIEQLQRITEEPGKPGAKKPKDDEHGQTKSADSEL